jgi:hypothetical protein
MKKAPELERVALKEILELRRYGGREAGYQVVGPAASIESARVLVAERGINAALLDIDLGEEGLCFGLATMLQAQHIPFAFLTGYNALLTPIEFRNSPRIEKPFSHEVVLTVVRHLLGDPPPTR